MNVDKALDELALSVGIVPDYIDLAGASQATSRQTKQALLQACGWQLDNDAMIVEACKHYTAAKTKRILPEEIITTSGKTFSLKTPKNIDWHLMLEGTHNVFCEGGAKSRIKLPALPSGIHELTISAEGQEQKTRLIAAPKMAPSLAEVTGQDRLWGVNLALFGLHSKRNPGVGDYHELAQLTHSLAGHGAGFTGINPVHAIGWSSPEVISPYSPSHRGFLNTSYIALDQISPASNASKELIAKWQQNAGSTAEGLIDYDYHNQHHRPLLRALYNDFQNLASTQEKAEFETFCSKSGAALNNFAQFENLSEKHGSDWRQWPSDLQTPANLTISNDDNAFHAWMQWHAETQLQAAHQQAQSSGMGLGLYLDLAVGARRDGAEAWGEADSIAKGVSVGAPPDHLSPAGQNWNLAAFAPQKLATNNYRAFANILSRNMRHCGILRIDHILGLNRSFWLPDDGSRGGYIKQNFEALLAIVRIQAERNGTVIIGEDLGLVPDGFRKSLGKSGIYSYSVLQYEKKNSGKFRKPSSLRKQSLACFGTHDTPTVRGFETGCDIDWWHKLSWIDEQEAKNAHQNRQAECVQLSALAKDKSNKSSLNHIVHNALAGSPVALVSVQLDDIEGKVEAQNLPSTIHEHPNWQRRYSTRVDDFAGHTGLKEMGKIMLNRSKDNSTGLKKENS